MLRGTTYEGLYEEVLARRTDPRRPPSGCSTRSTDRSLLSGRMADDPVLVPVERRADGVAVVTLDNPKVNALSSALLAQLKAAAEERTPTRPAQS